jgi:hypothetical protein
MPAGATFIHKVITRSLRAESAALQISLSFKTERHGVSGRPRIDARPMPQSPLAIKSVHPGAHPAQGDRIGGSRMPTSWEFDDPATSFFTFLYTMRA